MNDSHIVSITQLKEFLKGSQHIEFEARSQEEKYQWIGEKLIRFRYFPARKKDKSIIKEYIMRMTGYSDAQLTRLIAKQKKYGKIFADTKKRHKFPRKYTAEDIARLIETDNAHSRLSGPGTKRILKRMFEVFKDLRFERLKDISSAHIYNLRGTRQYKSHALTVEKTKPVQVPIGERRKPDPRGKPGYLRVDTVHQGDLDKEKGVYHINVVDEVTQWEIVGCAEKVISERYLLPLLKDLIEQLPFVIHGFHSDNGSEYINRRVAGLLNKLLIHQTKSRARHTNDNPLVEGKNGSVVRKHMGYAHIPKRYAPAINQFYKQHFNVYINYHRPCGFATVITDKKGKQKKTYPHKDYQMPYEKLKSLKNAEQYLKEGISFEILDKIAYEKSDNDCAALMQKAKQQLFKTFTHKLQLPKFPTTYTTFISGSYVD